jgi:hypothetical protein
MSYRAKNIEMADFPNHKKIVRERQPVIVFFMIAVLAAGTLISAALTVLILWTAMTEDILPPRQPYEQCGEVAEDTSRLACYDHVFRRISAHSVKNVRRMTFGGILPDN